MSDLDKQMQNEEFRKEYNKLKDDGFLKELKNRIIVTFNKEKVIEKYSTIEYCKNCNRYTECMSIERLTEDIRYNIECLKDKWNFYREDYYQGFDGDCAGHCCQMNLCMKIFKDKECITTRKSSWSEAMEACSQFAKETNLTEDEVKEILNKIRNEEE